jgi:hypothetical protein
MSVLISLRHQYRKRLFDPKKKEDLAEYRRYVKTRGWGSKGCPFELEYPYQDIPNMLAQKISKYAVEKL